MLAINGGEPVLTKPGPHYIWPQIDAEIETAVLAQLHASISIYNRSGIFEEFEDRFAQYHGAKHALLCNSGTSALHSMYVAADIQPGVEVICPAYTFFATVTPLLHVGAIPVLCDIDDQGNIDPLEIEKKISSKTRAVVVTHMWGTPCQMEKIVDICKRNNLLLFEDCSHAHGATVNGKPVGTFGDMAGWSLQGPKLITGGEGGILITNNDEYYYRSLLLGHYNKRCRQEIPQEHALAKYAVSGMGLKYRAHPLAVTIANVLFSKIDQYAATRNRYAEKMCDAFSAYSALYRPKPKEGVRPSWYGFIMQYREEEAAVPLETVHRALLAEGLQEVDRPGSTVPLHLLPLFSTPAELFPMYKDHPFSYQKGDFPKAERFYNSILKLPVWALPEDEVMVDAYIAGISKVFSNLEKLV